MTKMEIPSFKSSFGSLDWHVPIVLKVIGKKRIRSIQHVNEELVVAFISFLRMRGRQANVTDHKQLTYEGETYEGRKAHRRYLMSQLYSLAIPSCLKLGLVSQQEDQEMLTFFGRKLLDVINKSQSSLLHEDKQTMDMLRKIVMYTDHKHWKMLDVLSETTEGLFTSELITKLQSHGVEINVSRKAIEWHIRRSYLSEQEEKGLLKTWRDRERSLAQLEVDIKRLVEQRAFRAKINKVESLLGIIRSLGLIRKDLGKYYLNIETLLKMKESELWSDIQDISTELFFHTLKKDYEMLWKPQKYVPIPILRDMVCVDLDIPWDAFDEMLMSLGYEYSNYRIVLIPPVTSKVWGIFKGKKNFYYMSVEEMM